jgi:NADH-quinone oxidoreductase subunit A
LQSATHTALWPLVAFVAASFVITGSIIAITAVLGQRHRGGATDELYESGIPAAGPLPHRLSLEFYLVAMFFVVFDIETVFILAWAVAVRRLGWSGYLEVALFVVLLLAALLYLWRLGSLDWGTSGRMSGRNAWLDRRDAAASDDGAPPPPEARP